MTNHTAAQPLDLDKLEALARAASGGQWKWDGRKEDEDGYVHIPECSYLVGLICLAGHYEGYQEDCDFIAAANPATALALIAQARAAQPAESIDQPIGHLSPAIGQPDAAICQPQGATGTTGASIDTPEFRRLSYAYAEALFKGTVPETSAAWGAMITHIDTVIGDLRAQLAATTESLQIAAREAWDANAELSKLRAQLAAKGNATHGQGDPVAIVVTKGGQPHIDIIDATIKIGDHLYLAAPASAQPADACCKWPTCQSEEVQQRVADQAYRELYSGAQPDRGAAISAERAAAIEEIANWYSTKGWLMDEDDVADAIRALAAAPSPASQPVAQDEPLCPACQGSGEGLMMEGAGPDAYEVPCNCQYCGGTGGLLDAYNGLVALLAAEREKYLQACGKLFHANLAAVAPSDAKGEQFGPLDANELERMAKSYPDECFLKGSGVLKLIGAIRTLEQSAAKGKADAANAGGRNPDGYVYTYQLASLKEPGASGLAVPIHTDIGDVRGMTPVFFGAPATSAADANVAGETAGGRLGELAAAAPSVTHAEIYALRRLIECAKKLNQRPRPMCRDCADENGTCPNSGLECDMRKLFADAKALHNKLAAPALARSASQPPAPASRSGDAGGEVDLERFAKDIRHHILHQAYTWLPAKHAKTMENMAGGLNLKLIVDAYKATASHAPDATPAATSAADAKDAARWTKTPPTEQADYWNWDGDPDHAPMVYHVLWSGAAKKCFVSIGQYGIENAIWCDEFGGWWLKIEQPTTPSGDAAMAAAPSSEKGGAQ